MGRSKMPMSRRNFMTAAAGGIAGAGLLSVTGLRAEEKKVAARKGPIISRKLGKTGIEIPVVSMGVMNADNPEVVKASYELGVRHFDTAAYYQSGNNERMVGKVMKELGVRDEVVIATKIYTPDMRTDSSPAAVRKKMLGQIDQCLERLQMDYVDILYVHSIQSVDEIRDEAILGAMKEIKKSGKTRHIGISFHQDLHKYIDAAVEGGEYEVVLTALNMTLQDYTALFESIEKAAASGIGVIAMKTQAGSHRRSTLEYDDKFSSTTVATAALKWALKVPGITTAIPGYTTFEHMREDFSVASDLEYDEVEKKLLTECDIKIGMNFCRQCGYCVATCPGKVEIPTLMRTHMYATRYSNLLHARATLGETSTGRGLDRCLDCSACRAECRHSVDIGSGIEDLKAIYC